jgi:hypothetical protein
MTTELSIPPLSKLQLEQAARIYCRIKNINPDSQVQQTASPLEPFTPSIPRWQVIANHLNDVYLQVSILSAVQLPEPSEPTSED